MSLFKKDHIYVVNLEDVGEVECVWDGDDFYFNENIDCKCLEGIHIKGICIGFPLKNKYKILDVKRY